MSKDPAPDSGTLERSISDATASRPRSRPDPGRDLVRSSLLHFRIVERLGEGGMGVVYKAIDEKLRRSVALKVLNARYFLDERNVALLFREARSAAAVAHPNIGAIHEIHDEADPPFIVMELIDGESLRAAIARAPLSPSEALRIARSIAAALSRAHAGGVVHRDLKPDNVMLARDGQVKVLDFGLAKVAHEAEPLAIEDANAPRSAAAYAPTIPATSHPTEKGRVMGTPAYMSPEQARGDVVDARTDVFAFGVMLYEALTGAQPFARTSDEPWRWGGAESGDWKPRAPLRRARSEVPRELDAIVTRCLESHAERRYADGEALVIALDGITTSRAGARSRVPLFAALAVVLALAVGLGLVRRRAQIATRAGPASSTAGPMPLRTRVLFPRADGAFAISGSDVLVVEGDHLLRRPLSGASPAVSVPLPAELRGWTVTSISTFADPGHWLARATREKEEASFEVFLDGRPGRRVDKGGEISPDGKHVAYLKPEGALAIATLDGPETIVAARAFQGSVAWALNSDALAFGEYVDMNGANPHAVIDIVRSDGSARHHVVSDAHLNSDGVVSLAWITPRRLVYGLGESLGGSRIASIVTIDLDENLVAVGEPRVLQTMEGMSLGSIRVAGDSLVVSTSRADGSIRVAKLSQAGDSFDAPPAIAIRDCDPSMVGWLDRDRLLYATGEPPAFQLHIARFDGARADVGDFDALRPSSGRHVSIVEDGSLLSWEAEGTLGCRILRVRLDGSRETVTEWKDRVCPSMLTCARRGSRCAVRTTTDTETLFSLLDAKTGALGARLASFPGNAVTLSITISPDGSAFAYVTEQQGNAIVDIDKGTTSSRPHPPDDFVVSSVFGLDARVLYSTGMVGGRYAIRRFDREWRSVTLHTDPDVWFASIRMSPDGRTLSFYARDYSHNLVVIEPAR